MAVYAVSKSQLQGGRQMLVFVIIIHVANGNVYVCTLVNITKSSCLIFVIQHFFTIRPENDSSKAPNTAILLSMGDGITKIFSWPKSEHPKEGGTKKSASKKGSFTARTYAKTASFQERKQVGIRYDERNS